MKEIIYAIKVTELSYSGLKILSVKLGKTTNIKVTLRQYKRSNPEAEILDLWEPNPYKSPSECENGIHKIAEQYAYERKGETFTFLQENYKKFSENVNLLLKNVLVSEIVKRKRRITESYTGTIPESIKFQNKYFEVNSWREVLHKVVRLIYSDQKDLSLALRVKGTKRSYFSKDSKLLVDPQRIEGTPYFFEGNLSANQIMRTIDKLFKIFGYKKSDLKVNLRS